MYAVYSQKQRDYVNKTKRSTSVDPAIVPPPAFEWARADGSVVVCTSVGKTPGCPNVKWDDKQDLGEVARFVRALDH